MLRVFICHSSRDRGLAFDLEKRLQSRGVDAWIGSRGVPLGDDYAEAIPRALDDSLAFALV